MDKLHIQEANRLINVIKNEEEAKSLLAKAFHGFMSTEIEGCDIYISAYWKKGNEVCCMHEDNSMNAAKAHINGGVALYIIQRAIDKLGSYIEFHKM